MKKFRIFIFGLFLTINLFPQSWNNIINTGPTTSQAVGSDAFANQSGINVLYTTVSTGQIYYVLISSSGSILKQVLLDSGGYFPIIVGDNDNLFAVYIKNGSLKVLQSTNLFTSWTDISPINASNIPVTMPLLDRFKNEPTSGTYQMFDAAYKDGRLHVAWTETVNALNEAYYNQYYNQNWLPVKEEITSDYIGETGGRPRIAILPNQLIFSYNWLNNYSLGTVRTRYRAIGGPTWSSSVTAFNGNSAGEDISSDDTYIHIFYYQYNGAGQSIPLYHKKMLIGYSTWGSATNLTSNIDTWNGVKCSKTTNGVFGISYITFQISIPGSSNLIFRSFTNNTWNAPYTLSASLGYSEFFGFSTASNDLYFAWFNHPSNVSELYYRQYDAIPLAPQNLTVASVNGRPSLNWTKNNEADLSLYEVSRKDDMYGNVWYVIGTTTNNSFIDYERTITQFGYLHTTYRVRAKDVQAHFSPYSNEVSTITVPYKIVSEQPVNAPIEHALNQNYPNPFNPSTTILYSIKEDGIVTLKIYDILGKEIATLVNENKAAGSYEIEFNASHLPSGMYIYKIQAGSFSDVKKMLLTK